MLKKIVVFAGLVACSGLIAGLFYGFSNAERNSVRMIGSAFQSVEAVGLPTQITQS